MREYVESAGQVWVEGQGAVAALFQQRLKLAQAAAKETLLLRVCKRKLQTCQQ
jgi:hypothetical protein